MLRSWRSSQIFATQPVRAYGSEPPGREHAMLKNDLLASKLHVPHLRARLVPRPQVVELLEQGIRRALTLISAPSSGFGKDDDPEFLVPRCRGSGSLPLIGCSRQ